MSKNSPQKFGSSPKLLHQTICKSCKTVLNVSQQHAGISRVESCEVCDPKASTKTEHAGGVPGVAFENGQHVQLGHFDHSKVDEKLGWTERGNPLLGFSEQDSEQIALAIHALAKIARWLHNDGKCKRTGVHMRAYVFGWLIAPDMFHLNQRAMAKRIGVSQASLNRMVTSFRDQFDFRSTALRTEETRARYKERQRTVSARKAAQKANVQQDGVLQEGALPHPRKESFNVGP